MKKSLLFTLAVLSIYTSVFARIEGNALLNLIGKPIVDPHVNQLIMDLDCENKKEILEPGIDLYALEFYDKGIALDFTINFYLKGIRFYDSGFKYLACDYKLPFYLKMGLHEDEIVTYYKSFELNEYNKYEFIGHFDNGTVHGYTSDKEINFVRVTGNYAYIRSVESAGARNWKFRLLPDGECITGDCQSGRGSMSWGKGYIVYDGKWEHSMPNGFGMYTDSMGNSYSGGFKMGFFWGDGEFSSPNSYKYKGEFVMGTKTGQGQAAYTNGNEYDGSWLNDVFHGLGTYTEHAGYSYNGDFKSGQFNGYGKLETPDGYFIGFFRNGRPHGQGKQFSKSTGNYIEGKWVEGMKEGNFIAYGPNLPRHTIRFENDVEVALPGD